MTTPIRIFLAATCLFASFAGPVIAHAQIPTELDYQGYLADSAGTPLEAAVSVSFAIYAVEAGGTPLWSHTETIQPTAGLFSTTLGGVTNPFPAGLFATPLWLGVAVDSDPEMTPRRAMGSVPFAHRAIDADTIGGVSAVALDQSGDVALLEDSVTAAQSGIANNAGAVGTLQADVANAQSNIDTLVSDLNDTDSNLSAVENVIPTLQPLVTGACTSGSSIREIFPGGSVDCEPDDEGPWVTSGENALLPIGRVSIGAFQPAAALQIDAPVDVDPFRARIASSTKLRVHSNGSVSVGSNDEGSENGLNVAGNSVIGPGSSSQARLTVHNTDWQVTLDNDEPGGDDWWLGSSADAWAATGGKFIVSPTASSSNAALVIDSGKDVGIGVLDPLVPLHVDGGSDVSLAGGGEIILGDAASLNIAIDNNEMMARNNGDEGTLALNYDGGTVSINGLDGGTFIGRRERSVGGSVVLVEPEILPNGFEQGYIGTSAKPFFRTYSKSFYAASTLSYSAYSDRVLKRNVRPIDDALSTISRLEGVTYELDRHPLNDSERPLSEKERFDQQHQLGFIAQDVEEVLPQLVTTDEDSGLKAVGYMGVIPVLVEAIKAQQRRIEDQDARLVQQQQQIDELRRQIR